MESDVLLVSAFGPFGGAALNSSQEVVAGGFADLAGAGLAVRTLVLPVSWARAWPLLEAAIDPSVRGVLCLGQADRDGIQLEAGARNLASAELDVDGTPGPDGPLDPLAQGVPGQLASRLPLQRLEHDLAQAGHLVVRSDDAGDYLCNALSWRLLSFVHHRRADLVAGFVHLPTPERWPVEESRAAVRVLVASLVEHLAIRGRAMATVAPR